MRCEGGESEETEAQAVHRTIAGDTVWLILALSKGISSNSITYNSKNDAIFCAMMSTCVATS